MAGPCARLAGFQHFQVGVLLPKLQNELSSILLSVLVLEDHPLCPPYILGSLLNALKAQLPPCWAEFYLQVWISLLIWIVLEKGNTGIVHGWKQKVNSVKAATASTPSTEFRFSLFSFSFLSSVCSMCVRDKHNFIPLLKRCPLRRKKTTYFWFY